MRRLSRESGGLPVLVLTTDLTESLMLAVLRAGACGILLKDSDFTSLVRGSTSGPGAAPSTAGPPPSPRGCSPAPATRPGSRNGSATSSR